MQDEPRTNSMPLNRTVCRTTFVSVFIKLEKFAKRVGDSDRPNGSFQGHSEWWISSNSKPLGTSQLLDGTRTGTACSAGFLCCQSG